MNKCYTHACLIEEIIIPIPEMYVAKVLFNQNILDHKPLSLNYEIIGTHDRYPTTSHCLCHHHPGQSHHHFSYCHDLPNDIPASVTHPNPAPSWLSHNNQLILLKRQISSLLCSTLCSGSCFSKIKSTIFIMAYNTTFHPMTSPMTSSPRTVLLATLPPCWTWGTFLP